MVYDPTIDHQILDGDDRAQKNVREVGSREFVVLSTSDGYEHTVDFPNSPFRPSAQFYRKTDVDAVNDTLEGEHRGAVLQTTVHAGRFIDFWREVHDLLDEPFDEPNRTDQMVEFFYNRILDNIEQVPTPVVRLTEFGDLAPVPDGLDRAAALLDVYFDVVEGMREEPSWLHKQYMPVYIYSPNGHQGGVGSVYGANSGP